MDVEDFLLEEEGCLEMDIQYLLLGEDHFIDDGPLMVYGIINAITEDNLDEVKYFVESGKSENVNDGNGNTPLHFAVIKNNMDILDYLLSLDVNDLDTSNFSGETPLLFALKQENFEAAKKIISAGANVNIPNSEDVTPLHLSVKYPDLAHILIKNGAFLDAIDYSGDTPLHDATAEECLETVCMLLYYNAEPNIRGVNNLTPFMKALISRNVEIQAVLIDYVDDYNVETYDHISMLALALHNKSPFVEEIINGGANVNYAYGYDLIDIFSTCLQVPNAKNFKLIWDKLKYDNSADIPLGSLLWRICGTVREEHVKQYLNIIIESDNIPQVVESVTNADDLYLVIVRFSHYSQQLNLEQLTKLICQLLSYGYIMTSFDMSKIFLHFGYCELFKMLLHMDIKITGRRPPDMSRFIYDVGTTPKELFKQLIDIIKTEYLHNTIYQLLDYYIYPKLLNAYLNLNRKDYVTEKILYRPQIPSLLELSRDASREVLMEKYKPASSRHFYTLLNDLDMSPEYKKILSFERVLYKYKVDTLEIY